MNRLAHRPALTALALALALGMLALGLVAAPFSLLLLPVAGVFAWMGTGLYRANVEALGARATPRLVGAWLFGLVVLLPNLLMALLLYAEPARSGPLAVLSWVLVLFAFTAASLYYLVPAWLGGEKLFLLETVISPHGLAGLALAALTWTVLAAALLAVVHWLAMPGRR